MFTRLASALILTSLSVTAFAVEDLPFEPMSNAQENLAPIELHSHTLKLAQWRIEQVESDIFADATDDSDYFRKDLAEASYSNVTTQVPQ